MPRQKKTEVYDTAEEALKNRPPVAYKDDGTEKKRWCLYVISIPSEDGKEIVKYVWAASNQQACYRVISYLGGSASGYFGRNKGPKDPQAAAKQLTSGSIAEQVECAQGNGLMTPGALVAISGRTKALSLLKNTWGLSPAEARKIVDKIEEQMREEGYTRSQKEGSQKRK